MLYEKKNKKKKNNNLFDVWMTITKIQKLEEWIGTRHISSTDGSFGTVTTPILQQLKFPKKTKPKVDSSSSLDETTHSLSLQTKYTLSTLHYMCM